MQAMLIPSVPSAMQGSPDTPNKGLPLTTVVEAFQKWSYEGPVLNQSDFSKRSEAHQITLLIKSDWTT